MISHLVLGTFFKGRNRPDGMSPRYKLFRITLTTIAKVLFGFTSHGAEKVPAKGPLVVASNHTQYLDPFYVGMAVPRRVQWMAKKELFVFPLRGFFALLGAFPVDRQKGGRAALRTATEHLGAGWALGIFPEGTHKQGDKPREAKSGAVVIAARSGARILPVYIGPAPGLRARLRGEKLRAYVGVPIEIDANLRGGEAYKKVSEDIMREIYALPEKSGFAPPTERNEKS